MSEACWHGQYQFKGCNRIPKGKSNIRRQFDHCNGFWKLLFLRNNYNMKEDELIILVHCKKNKETFVWLNEKHFCYRSRDIFGAFKDFLNFCFNKQNFFQCTYCLVLLWAIYGMVFFICLCFIMKYMMNICKNYLSRLKLLE